MTDIVCGNTALGTAGGKTRYSSQSDLTCAPSSLSKMGKRISSSQVRGLLHQAYSANGRIACKSLQKRSGPFLHAAPIRTGLSEKLHDDMHGSSGHKGAEMAHMTGRASTEEGVAASQCGEFHKGFCSWPQRVRSSIHPWQKREFGVVSLHSATVSASGKPEAV